MDRYTLHTAPYRTPAGRRPFDDKIGGSFLQWPTHDFKRNVLRKIKGNGDLVKNEAPDLDTVQEFVPIDMERCWSDYLANIGVKPAYQRTYKQACKEGWAPPPTNDIQRAIWDKVHQIPDKPMTIEFDPKKDK